MEDEIKNLSEKKISDLLFNIRHTLHVIGIQQEMMTTAVEKCKQLNPNNLKACSEAVGYAHQQILRFLELNVILAKYIDELKKYVSDQELKAAGIKK